MSDTAANPTGPDAAERAERKRLARRYRADARFRWYGIAALALSVLFLCYFLFDIVSRGYTAFIRHDIEAALVLTEETFEDTRLMVREVDPELLSEATLLEVQLAVSRYEVNVPVRIDAAAVEDPRDAVTEGVRLEMASRLAGAREDLRLAERRGDDRAARRLRRTIERFEASGHALIASAASFVDAERLSRRIDEMLDAAGGAEAAVEADAAVPRVEPVWAPLSEPASRSLLGAATSLSVEESATLQDLVFYHFGRFADDYYRRRFNPDAVGGAGERRRWVTAASDVDLYLKGKRSRLFNEAEEYGALLTGLGVAAAAEPDAFVVMAGGLRAQREQAEAYAALMDELGLDPAAALDLPNVLAAAASRRGDGRTAEDFRASIADAGGAGGAAASLRLPAAEADSATRLLAALTRADRGLPDYGDGELQRMQANHARWAGASEAAAALAGDPERLRSAASTYHAADPTPRGAAYAELAGFLGLIPIAEPEPFEVFSAALTTTEVVARDADALLALADAWGKLREVDALRDAGRTRSTFNTAIFVNTNSNAPEVAGLWNAIVGSVFLLVIVLVVAFPIGVLTAIYLEEFAPDNWFTRTVEVNINNLAAVPSILFGLLGLAVFVNLAGLQRAAALAGGLTLSLMSLPVIIIATRAALSAVPDSIRKGAQAMGATRWQSVTHHVLPLALPGILTGTIIALAQAIGETAPLLIIGMVGFRVMVPESPTDPTTALPAQIYTWFADAQAGFGEKAAAGILVLLAVLLSMNALAILLRAKFEKKW